MSTTFGIESISFLRVSTFSFTVPSLAKTTIVKSLSILLVKLLTLTLNKIANETMISVIIIQEIEATLRLKLKETASTIQNLEHVDAVRYGEGVVENLVDVFGIIRNITIVAVIALIFVTAFLISNTIKITIYSRKNEIDIMRLVGTSNTVIRF